MNTAGNQGVNTQTSPQEVAKISAIKEKMLVALNKLGIYHIEDLLFHLPIRYQNRTCIVPLRDLRPNDQATIEGKVIDTKVILGRRRHLVCRLLDKTHTLTLRFFYFSTKQQQSLRPGVLLRCFGQVRAGHYGLEMIHPDYRFVHPNDALEATLTPVYSTLTTLSQTRLQRFIDQARRHYLNDIEELLPQPLLDKYQLVDIKQALNYIHRPPPDANLTLLLQQKHPYQQRLALEELLAHHLSLRVIKKQTQQQQAIASSVASDAKVKLLANLTFKLTHAQQQVLETIEQDLAKTHPMLRLIQGDVGSGKTIVATLATLTVIKNGYQVALMAPTELLAQQHLKNFQQWFQPFAINIAWLAGSVTGKAKKVTLEAIANGQSSLIIGTHALFQQQVKFNKLVLLIIDEQHRFGVHQRLALRDKAKQGDFYPHQLVMTATPIPRTLAMSAYADLDISIIDELPSNRKPVSTVAIANDRRCEVITSIQKSCQQKRQVYWVCTLIEESEALQAQAAEKVAAQLKQSLAQVNIALVHGRMKSAQKEQVMQAFKDGTIDLLVATTVIEVGVDVPNASLMIIENAERLGLSQLHQLRGRVGRGSVTSHCVLLYQPPLSEISRKRLAIMRATNDGFKIARADLKLRGPGEILGVKQKGMMQMRIADLMRDQHLLPSMQQLADIILQHYPPIITKLIRRWLGKQAKNYSQV